MHTSCSLGRRHIWYLYRMVMVNYIVALESLLAYSISRYRNALRKTRRIKNEVYIAVDTIQHGKHTAVI